MVLAFVFSGGNLPPRRLSTGSADPKDETEADSIPPELEMLLLMKPNPEPPWPALAAVVEPPDDVVAVAVPPTLPNRSEPALEL